MEGDPPFFRLGCLATMPQAEAVQVEAWETRKGNLRLTARNIHGWC